MIDDPSKNTIDEYLRLARTILNDAGVSSTVEAAGARPHGCVMLQYFDPEHGVVRNYPWPKGASPFRNFVRHAHIVENTQRRREIRRLLEDLKNLQEYFSLVLQDGAPSACPAGRDYLFDLVEGNETPWPDEMYLNFSMQISGFKEIVLGEEPKFIDLHAQAPLDYEKIDDEHCLEYVIRDAVEVVCMGPWAGLPAPAISSALKQLHDELKAGSSRPSLPLARCLEPGRTWRCLVPLWRAGSFEGLFNIIIAGSQDQLEMPPEALMDEFQVLGGRIFTVLEQQRIQHAENVLKTWFRNRKSSFEKAIEEAASIVIAPHRVAGVQVYGIDTADAAPSGPSGGATGDDRRLIGCMLDQAISIDVELYHHQDKYRQAAMEIYVQDELCRIGKKLLAEPRAAVRESHGALSFELLEVECHNVLNQKRGNELKHNDFFTCFICLAIIEMGFQTREIILQDGKIASYQKRLNRDYRIMRRTKSKTNSGILPASQLCKERQLDAGKLHKALFGILIERGVRQELTIRGSYTNLH